ncbi:hypothetical protein CPC08DRAFT_637341 [Agrocybe pediades]|nr:hypothetical protein CPC08DRAFT_637341 [Agrocybe pediades]
MAFVLLAALAASVSAQAIVRSQPYTPDISKDYNLLDTVLVATVDGKFHAVNRTGGHTLWSMSSFVTTTSVSAPSSLSPLVRTSQSEEPDDEETYIIEPQSGDIYVLHAPSSPLQRFPFSMPELVDISPFTSVTDEGTTVFVGRKETSLLLIELETGRIKATLNAECPFIPDEHMDEVVPLDLDELEGSKPPLSAPTEVYIGRTDYIISIHKKPKPGMPKPAAQELIFSQYGPNNRDNQLQSMYRRTADDIYIQSLTSGEIIAFDTSKKTSKKDDGLAIWANRFNAPAVAVFDVLVPSSPSILPSHPFVLLQPRPKLQDLFPKFGSPSSTPDPLLRNLHSAYVGMMEDSGSLFVMSPDQYPLVVFGASGKHRMGEARVKKGDGKWRAIDAPGKSGESSGSDPELDFCLDNPRSGHCLVGIRPLEEGDGIEGRLRRLIDAPKPKTQTLNNQVGSQPMSTGRAPHTIVVDSDNTSTGGGSASAGERPSNPPYLGIDAPPAARPNPTSAWMFLGLGGSTHVDLFGIMSIFILLLSLVAGWLGVGKVKAKLGIKAPHIVVEKEKGTENKEQVNGHDESTSTTHVEVPVSDGKAESNASKARGSNGVLPPVSISTNGESADHAMPAPALKKSKAKELPTSLDLPDPLSTPTVQPDTTPGTAAEDGEDSDAEGEVDAGADGDGGQTPATPGRRRTKRGKRGGKKKKAVVIDAGDKEKDKITEEENKPPSSSLILTSSTPKPPVVQQPSLVVSDTILGFGSHGTVVFQGSLQGRAVAVKRLLNDFVTLAAREVSILQDSDDHPNVIRYYYQEAHGNFLYIALELCPASLADIIESPDREQWRELAINFDPKKALRQITSGLRHLHALKLVHRDIKPQNILISFSGTGAAGTSSSSRGKGYRMLISDFGLCKRLDVDQTSFLPTAHGALAAGTVGWRAPEILRGEVKLEDSPSMDDGSSLSSRGSVATINGNSSTGGMSANGNGKGLTRLTKSVDIFALGCLFYYTLTSGGHPYGDRFEREVNIMRDAKDLSGLDRFGEEGTEAKHLIEQMLSFEPKGRPDTTTILLHPFFWDPARRLNFLQDASDRFEIMCRDPRDAHLIRLERGALAVVGNDWHSRLDKIFIENLGKYRKYDGKSVQDLLRALRNKKHHYQDLPDNVKRHLGPMPEGFLGYFTRRYPQLFLHVHTVIGDTGLYNESMFRTYFELPDT